MNRLQIFLSSLFLLFLISNLSYAAPNASVGAIASKEIGNAVQSMRSYDTNMDGKKDRFDYYERGNLVTIAYDRDQDGNLDEKDIVDHGVIVEKDQLDKNGKVITVQKVHELPDQVKQA